MILHFSTDHKDDYLCGSPTRQLEGHTWMDVCLETYAKQVKKDRGDKEDLIPCQECMDHPDYPLHMLNGEKL